MQEVNKRNFIKVSIMLTVMLLALVIVFMSSENREKHTQTSRDMKQTEQTKRDDNLPAADELNKEELFESSNYTDTDTDSKNSIGTGKQKFTVVEKQAARTTVIVKEVSDWKLTEEGSVQVEVTLQNAQKEDVFVQKVGLFIINVFTKKPIITMEKEADVTIKPGDSVQIILEKEVNNINIFPENDRHLLYEVFLE
jgi:hypothetical protein